MNKIRKVIFLSFMVGIALVIYIVESQIPVLFPGIKLGLANSISLLALILLGWKEAILIMFLRTLLGSIFTGNMMAFMFSVTGGLFSNIIMIILYKYFKESINICTISVCGAIFHNVGQLLVASFVVNNFKIYLYLPVLMIAAVITGYFTGLVTKYASIYLKNVIDTK